MSDYTIEGIAAVTVAVSLLPILSLMRRAWSKKVSSWKVEPDAFNAWADSQMTIVTKRELVEIPQSKSLEDNILEAMRDLLADEILADEPFMSEEDWNSLMVEADRVWTPGKAGKIVCQDEVNAANYRVTQLQAQLKQIQLDLERAKARAKIVQREANSWAPLISGLARQELWAYVKARSGFFANWCQTQGLSEDMLDTILNWKKGGRYVPILCQIAQILGDEGRDYISHLQPEDIKHLYRLRGWELVPEVKAWVESKPTCLVGYWSMK